LFRAFTSGEMVGFGVVEKWVILKKWRIISHVADKKMEKSKLRAYKWPAIHLAVA